MNKGKNSSYSYNQSNNRVTNSNNNFNANNQPSTVESDIDKLTKDFAKMRLHVCYRCHQRGHDAKYCTNEISEENHRVLQLFNNQEQDTHLNY